MTKQPLELADASLPFIQYQQAGKKIIEFDSRGCHCPVPMRNAMAGLERIAASGETLVMLNGFEPQGLYERISGFFDWRVVELDSDQYRIVFNAIEGKSVRLDFSQRDCKG